MSEATPKKQFTAERQRLRRRVANQVKPVPAAKNADASDVTNAVLLQAIYDLRGELLNGSAQPAAAAPPPSNDDSDQNYHAEDVRIEIAQMVRSIARAKNEIASISHPMSDDDRLASASSELDAIVLATETATKDILEANEEISALIDQIVAACPDNQVVGPIAEQIAEHLVRIIEACSFQDITGQRINKVVNALQFIQDRILAMIAIWGIDAFEDLPVCGPGEEATDDEKSLLNGPQLENEGITQAEIDALFD